MKGALIFTHIVFTCCSQTSKKECDENNYRENAIKAVCHGLGRANRYWLKLIHSLGIITILVLLAPNSGLLILVLPS